MNTLLQVATILGAVVMASSSIVKSSGDGNFELLILHNNDMHARFEQTSQLSGACTVADRDAGKCYGGFPRVAHVVKEARRAAASGEGPPVLYLNAGDTYTGTAWFTIYKWKIAAEFINALQPDAVSLGNNELEAGSKELSPFLYDLKTVILASNIIVKSEQEQKLQKSVIFNMNDVNVGVVGYLEPNMNILDGTDNIEYIDEVIAIKEEVDKLKEQNVNIIIALGHADPNKDLEIAKQVEGLDLIITGHKNNFYWNGSNADAQSDDMYQPIVVTQGSGRRVPIIQSHAYNKYLGKLHAKFDVDGEIETYRAEPILLDSSIPQDFDTSEVLKKYNKEITSRTNEIVGETAVVLDGESCRVAECNLGNLITDAMMYHYALRFEGDNWTDAPVAIIPGGTIAASISPSNRPAAVTFQDLLTALPSESHLVAVTMNGDVLIQLLEHSVASYSVSNPTGQFLQFSGIRVVYDIANPPGSRVVSAMVRCWNCFVPEFYAIDSWRDYKIIMPAALANGEYGYSMLVDLPRDVLTYDEVTCTAEFIQLRSPVYPEVAGRIDVRNSAIALSSSILLLCVTLIPFFNTYK